MSVQQVLRKIGSWSIKLREDAPPGVISALDYFGHVAIVPGRLSPVERGDELLSLARYVGILRTVQAGAQVTLSGVGMAAWLGDEDGKGDVIEAPGVTLSGATFAAAVAALLPSGGAVTAGTLTNIAGTYSATHTYQTPRSAIDYVCDLFGGEWRVNGDGTLDAGPASALFVTTPTAMIVRDGAGYDATLKALPGELESTRDAKDTTTRVVVVGNGLAAGSADVPSTPYRDIHGNAIKVTRVVDEQDDTSGANAGARAQAVLNLFSGTRRSVRLSADEFDIAGDFEPGDTVWVYDPAAGLADTAYEVTFRGRTINPMPVRCLALTWPVTQGYTVGYRDHAGAWTDLTPWVDWDGARRGEVEVADTLSPALTSGIGTIGTVVSGGGGGAGDASIPDVPTFGTFTTSSYQPGDGLAQAQIRVTWTQPLNTDASTIVDGDHYEIRYRPSGATDWQVTYVGWDQTSVNVIGLSPSTTYDFQIRAVDYASPINYGAWSATTSYLAASDTTPPATPAAPTVAASEAAVQVTHTLGLASGGTYNLPLDMDHFDVHIGTSAGFTPSTATLAGKLQATASLILGGIPAVGTYLTDPYVGTGAAAYVKVVAVDRTGNASTASSAASATAALWDSAHISDLTVSKVTAGTLSATVLLSGLIRTATSGARVEMDSDGLRLYNSGGTNVVDLNASTGAGTFTGTITGSTVTGGTVQTGTSGQRITMDATNGGTIFFRDSGSDYGFINGPGSGLGVNSGNGGGPYRSRVYLTPGSGFFQNVDASQTQVGGGIQVYSSGIDVNTNSGTAFLRSTSGSVQITGTSGLTATTSGGAWIQGGTMNCTSTSGNATYGAPSNRYALFDPSGNSWLVNGSAYVSVSPTTIDNVSTAFKASAVYSATTANAANVFVVSGGQMYRSTSSARYKAGIEPAELDADAVLSVDLVTFYDKREMEENGGSTDGLVRHVGALAEQVAQIPVVGDLLVPRDEEGRPDSIEYSRYAVMLAPIVRDLRERVAALELDLAQ